MNNTIQLITDTDQHAEGLARAVGAFLSAEASGLTEILETVGEFDAADAVRHLTELCQAPQADAGHIAGTLDEVLDGLLHIPFLLIDQAAYAGMPDEAPLHHRQGATDQPLGARASRRRHA